MLKIINNNFKQNKKTTILFLISIVIGSSLIFITCLLFSSIHSYLVNEVGSNVGNYHVKIKSDLNGYENFSKIKKVVWKDDYVLITYNDVKKVYTLTNKLCKETTCKEITYNKAYLSLFGISKNNDLLNTFKSLIIITLIIILLSSSFIIYNVYKILFYFKIHQIGILKSIGMTLKQLRIMLIIESLIFSVIGIILGFILSLILMIIFISIISNLIDNIKLSINLTFLFYSFIFLLFLVFFICLIPIFKINKEPIKLLNKGYKTKQINKKFKNIIFYLSYLNYKRSKKHYKSVIISLFVFIVLFVTFNMYLKYGLEIINNYVIFPTYDAKISVLENNEKAYSILKKFANENNTKYKIYKTCEMKINVDKNNYINNGPSTLNLYLIEGDNYFINKTKTIVNDNKIHIENKKYFKDKIILNINNQNLTFSASNKIPFGYEDLITKDNLIVSAENISNLCNPNLTMFIKSNKNLGKELNKLLKENLDIYYVNTKKGIEYVNNIVLIIKVFLYGVIILSLFIGISSIISSSFLSMEYRKKEFGLLKSLGFKTKDFKDLIIIESLLITSKAFIIALPFILVINCLTNSILNEVIEIKLITPFKLLLLSFLISIVVVRSIMQICFVKIKNSSILNLIYNDNI